MPAHHPSDLGGLALDRVAEDERRKAGGARDLGRGFERSLRRRDDSIAHAREDGIAGLRRFRFGVVEQSLHGRRNLDAVAPERRPRLRERAGIGRGRTRGDHGRIVARHVGNDQRHDFRRRRGRGEAPGLDRREMLAHAVDVPDRRAALRERAVDRLLVRQRQARRRQGESAEPPPEMRQRTRSSGPRPRTLSRIRRAASWPAASGTGWLASMTSIRSSRPTP